ncbi:MAG: glycosyltransferase [Candidatus Eisenbacteria bacterium]|nr:glycosyltransferase [Candidatus Eisenbacteria bacterium]
MYVNHMVAIEPVPVLQAPIVSEGNRLRKGLVARASLDGGGEGGVSAGLRRVLSRLPLLERLVEARRIARIARREECRLLCSFLLKSNRVAALAKLFFLSDLPLVVCVHEMLSLHLESAHRSAASRTLHRWIARLVLREADRIIAVSEGVRLDLTERLGASPEKIVVLPNPVDREAVLAAAARPPSEDPWGEGAGARIVAVGRLVTIKGFDLLLRAMAALPESPGARLALIGEGPERGELENSAERLGLGDRVRFLGELSRPWTVIARADLFVLPSREDAAPNTLAEAMILGLPIVAADCSPGVREMLEGGAAGLLVPPGDPDALALAMERLLGDRALRERLAARASERSRAHDLEGAVRLFEEILLPLMDRDNHSRSTAL